jgi:hypothetical protein
MELSRVLSSCTLELGAILDYAADMSADNSSADLPFASLCENMGA